MSKSNKNSSDLIEKVVSVNKVSKTVKGGKNFSFAVLVVVGDKKGRVGFGKGKAKEVADAKNKAFESARKSLVKISLKEGRTIHHDVDGKFCSARVNIRTAPVGTGVIAGGAMRSIFECAGISDVVSKSLGTSNPYNMVWATFKAFGKLLSPRNVADRRSKDISDIIKKRNLILKVNNSNNNNNSES